jgi:hypothetical protein
MSALKELYFDEIASMPPSPNDYGPDYDNYIASLESDRHELFAEVDRNMDREDADGMLQDWQTRAHELGIDNLFFQVALYRRSRSEQVDIDFPF